MIPRALLLPRLQQPRDPTTVEYKTPTEDPDTYFETVLTWEEAMLFAAQIQIDAHRAKEAAEAAARRNQGADPR